MQADGNGSDDYMHSGMRGVAHVGAFRRCSFTKAECYSERSFRAFPVIDLLVSGQQALWWLRFRPSCKCYPSASGRPSTKLIPSQRSQKNRKAGIHCHKRSRSTARQRT